MIRRTPHDANRGLARYPCEHCGAAENAYCTTPSGAIAPWSHAARYRAAFRSERPALDHKDPP